MVTILSTDIDINGVRHFKGVLYLMTHAQAQKETEKKP